MVGDGLVTISTAEILDVPITLDTLSMKEHFFVRAAFLAAINFDETKIVLIHNPRNFTRNSKFK